MKAVIVILGMMICSACFGQTRNDKKSTALAEGGLPDKAGSSTIISLRCHTANSLNNRVPLFVVDGKQMAREDVLQCVNPDDIVSITILKGKEAMQQYGNEGANGVILIQLKTKTLPAV